MFTSDDSLFFLHVPKTAGTSLVQWISSQFDTWERCPFGDALAFRDASPADLAPYRFFAGHLRPEFVQQFPRVPRVVTWLREPAARLYSSYRYLREMPSADEEYFVDSYARQQRETARRLSFEDWLGRPRTELYHHDYMAHMLAPYESPTSAVTGNALAMLAGLDFVGLVERMQDSVDLLCYRFAWLPREMGVRLRVARGGANGEISDRARALVSEFSARDQIVYDHARSRFEQQWSEMVEHLLVAHGLPPAWENSGTGRAELHRAIERHVRFIRQHCSGVPDGTLPFGDGVPSRGFMPAVRSGVPPHQVAVRWLGPDPVGSVFLRFPPMCNSRLSFTIAAMMEASVLADLIVEVNGERVYCEILPAPEELFPAAHRLSVVVPWRVLAREPGLARVRFSLPRTWPEPVARDQATRPNCLGFAIREFEILAISTIKGGVPRC